MLKTWYYHRKHGQRLLSLETIAEYCGCDVETVQKWFDGKIIHSAVTTGDVVEAGEVISFLVKNSMPVYSPLLPPNSRKILFINLDNQGMRWQQNFLTLVLSFFQDQGNILVDHTSTEKFASLTVLTFVPDVVICFLQGVDQTTAGILSLLSSLPELSTILVGNDTVLKNLHTNQMLPEHCLTISNSLSEDRLKKLLNSAYGKH